jgi:hypothetical protein
MHSCGNERRFAFTAPLQPVTENLIHLLRREKAEGKIIGFVLQVLRHRTSPKAFNAPTTTTLRRLLCFGVQRSYPVLVLSDESRCLDRPAAANHQRALRRAPTCKKVKKGENLTGNLYGKFCQPPATAVPAGQAPALEVKILLSGFGWFLPSYYDMEVVLAVPIPD